MAEVKPEASAGRADEAGWRRSLKRVGVDMRPGEGEPAFLLFVFLFLLLTFQISTETVRQSTFIDSLGAARLPWVYLLVALTSYPFLLFYNRFVDRYRVEQLLAVSCVGVAVLLVGAVPVTAAAVHSAKNGSSSASKSNCGSSSTLKPRYPTSFEILSRTQPATRVTSSVVGSGRT